MMFVDEPISMKCPYCGREYPLSKAKKYCTFYTEADYFFNFDMICQNAYLGKLPDAFELRVMKCPAEDCGKIVITLDHIMNIQEANKEKIIDNNNLHHQIMPVCITRNFPDYVPTNIIEDYREAAAVLDLSPKASAVLSRRCIDELITDHFKVTQGTLYDKINSLEKQLSSKMIAALNSLRSIGNAGAHLKMSSDIIVDVSKEEAQAFLWFIEYIIDEWYVEDHEKEKMINKIAGLKK